jgi:hypothetical protein
MKTAKAPNALWPLVKQATKTVAVAALALALAPQPASAQTGGTFDLSWHSVDGGGATPQTGGAFIMQATIGQHDTTLAAQTISGGNFDVIGGFLAFDHNPPQMVCADFAAQLSNDLPGMGMVTLLPANIDGGSSDDWGIETLEVSDDNGMSFVPSILYSCGDVTNLAPSQGGPLPAYAITLRGTDYNGNSATCMAMVTVEDNFPPTMDCVAPFSVELDPMSLTITLMVSDIDEGTQDNCTLISLEISRDNMTFGPTVMFDCADLGPQTVFLRGTDQSDNQNTCSTTVTILSPPSADLGLAPVAVNKISSTQGVSPSGGITPTLANTAEFPSNIAALDTDGNGSADIIAAASTKEQAVRLFRLNAAGQVIQQGRFGSGSTAALQGGFPGSQLLAGDNFGCALAWLGDMPSVGAAGTVELAVGVSGEDGSVANSNRGGFWIVSLNLSNFTTPVSSAILRDSNAIDAAPSADGLADTLLNTVGVCSSLSALDVTGDGVADWLAAGAPNRVNATDHQTGAVWLMRLNANGALASADRFTAPDEGVYQSIQARFGDAVEWLAGPDNDPMTWEIAVGAPHHRGALGGLAQSGVVYVLSFDLTTLALLPGAPLIGGSQGLGGFPASQLGQADFFAQSLASLGDLDGDGHREIAIGAPGDDDGSSNQGAVWVLSLEPCGGSVSRVQRKISELSGSFAFGGLDSSDYFGWSMAPVGLLPGGSSGLAIGARYDDDGASNRGAAWVFNLGD